MIYRKISVILLALVVFSLIVTPGLAKSGHIAVDDAVADKGYEIVIYSPQDENSLDMVTVGGNGKPIISGIGSDFLDRVDPDRNKIKTIFTADFDSFNDQFHEGQGSMDGITIDNGVLKWANGAGIALVNGFSGKDYIVKVTGTYEGKNSGYGVAYRTSMDENGDFNGYVFQFDPGSGEVFVVKDRTGYIEFCVTDDETNEKAKVKMGDDFNVDGTHDISISVKDTRHVIKVDGEVIMDFKDSAYTKGSAGIRVWTNNRKDNVTTISDFEITGN